jgi:hypothetical protein
MNNYKALALIGRDSPSVISQALASRGFEILSLPRDERLQLPVSSHADMLVSVIENNIFCSEQYYYNNEKIFSRIASYGYTVTPCKIELSSKYPNDIAFNMLYIKNCILGKTDLLPQEIKNFSEKAKIDLLPIKQGYAKCSTLLLNNKAIISADNGIIKKASSLGLSTLKIENSPEAITLCGYDYGFIGGASGVFDKSIYFVGDIKLHPQSDMIIDFCTKMGFEAISLGDHKLCDIGGIIFLPYLS